MPCNAIATARAKVGNLAQLAEFDQQRLAAMVYGLCCKKFENERFTLQVRNSEIIIRGSRQPDAIAQYAKQVIDVLAQRALAAKVAKIAKINSQTVAANGAMVLEVEL